MSIHLPKNLRSRLRFRTLLPSLGVVFSAATLTLLLACGGAQEKAPSNDEATPQASTEGKAVPDTLDNENAGEVWTDQVRAQLVKAEAAYDELALQVEKLGQDGETKLDQASQDAAEQYHQALLAADQKVTEALEASEELSEEAKAELQQELQELEKGIAELRAQLADGQESTGDETAAPDEASSGDESSGS